MTRRKRNTLIVLAVLAVLVGGEVALNLAKGPEACVEVVNKGTEPIENLVAVFGSSRVEAPRVAAGASSRLLISGQGPQTLRLSYRQSGNGMGGYQVPGFDPGLMTQEGSKLVVEVHPNQVVKYQDEGEPTTPAGRYARDLWDRAWKSLTTLD